MSTRPKRPVIRYFGGKYRLAPWVVKHFPAHRTYTEAFGGAASVLLAKPRTYAEVYNDLDGEVVNLFRVLRNQTSAAELERLIRLTPFARSEFRAAYEPTENRIERARRTVVKAFMGFGSNSIGRATAAAAGFNCRMNAPPTGFRGDSNRSGTTPAHDWRHYPDAIGAFIDRLQGVVIDNRDALEVIAGYDRPDALHYVDPPYVSGTRRSPKDGYRHEMTDDQHRELAALLHSVQGYVVLSGYRSALYDEMYADWHVEERPHRADGARPTVEILWLSPRTAAALPRTLFDGRVSDVA